MQLSQSQLRDYTFLSTIRKNMDLVRNNVTGELMLRRISPAEDYPVLSALTAVRQRNLMAVYDAEQRDGICVSLCEYVSGVTLETAASGGVYDVKTARNVMCQICDGLSALHANNIVHRDIKPENIMIDGSGNVKIIDYSISRLMKPSAAKDTTILGTAGYASPEQFGFAQTTATADIYACGVLLNYLLTGMLPNEELHTGSLKTIIERCIEIDEKKRFRSADDLKKILQGKRINTRRQFRPLPGFRSHRVFPKIITTIFISAWIFMLLVFVNGFTNFRMSDRELWRFIILCADFMFFWTAAPYFLFGDIFRLSEKLNPSNPRNGKYVLRALGVLSIVAGVVLLVVGVQVLQ